MKNRGIAKVLFIMLVAANLTGQDVVKRGILDLRESGFRRESIIKLNGEWEFYWREHLRPVDFIKADTARQQYYSKVPSYWTSLADTIKGITPDGYATYRMRILLPEYFRTDLVFQVPVFDSSYRLYIDGKLVGSNGIPGQKITETKPDYNPLLVNYKPSNDTLDIIFNVSNYHHRRGGFWLPLTVGTSETMILKIKREEIFTAGSLGVLFAFTVFFFIFFIIFQRDRTMLYFSMATFGLMLRTMFTGSFPALSFINIPWTWIIRMEYTGSYIALIFSLLYFYMIYRDNFIRYINTVLISLFGILILFVLTTPVSLFSWSVLLLIPVVSINLAYYTVRSFITLFRKRNYEGLMALGFLALLLGTANDIFTSTSSVLLTHKYILPHTTLFFILMQAIILIFRWVHSYNEENRLYKEVEFVNHNLESIVIERTTELTNQKGELEKQYELVDQKNRELQETIAIKNRIFSIIAHDLKSPVLNLSLMIDQLKDNKDRPDFGKITGALSQQSGFALSLIDNLLLWGEGQQNRIKYNPAIYNITDLVLENFNLVREMAERKEINMSYSHKGDARAIFDRDLINIVIRNLLSNSIKFTHRKGNITVSVEEESTMDGLVYLKIRDNGVGIPADKLDNLFKAETIFSTNGTENEKGTGLGLQLCHDLVSLNKGHITIESTPETGTSVTIMLPSQKNR